MSDDEDYELEYSDSDGSEPDVDLENTYYAAKAMKADDDIKGALEGLQKVLAMETEKGDWGFKALKQMVKLTFSKGDYDKMLEHYKQLLTYIKTAVTKNYAEKSINSILDYVSNANESVLLQQFYRITLEALKGSKNERLWFKTNIKLGRLYLDLKQFDELEIILKELRTSCRDESGEDDQKKGTQLMEIYALEIQMYTELKNTKAMNALYEQSLNIRSAIPHPLILGTIRECGGKMHLRQGEFDKAHTDFFEAFKNYDESGSQRRISCLKYFVLTNMLMKSAINPFDSQETNPFRNEPEIVAMTHLVNAYQDNDLERFEEILSENRDAVMGDQFIREHVEELLSNIRTEVLLRIIEPFKSIMISQLTDRLKIVEEETVRLLVGIIHDRRKDLRIDQINRTLLVVGSNAAKVQEHGESKIPESVGYVEENAIDPPHSSALMKLLAGLEQVNSTLSEKAI